MNCNLIDHEGGHAFCLGASWAKPAQIYLANLLQSDTLHPGRTPTKLRQSNPAWGDELFSLVLCCSQEKIAFHPPSKTFFIQAIYRLNDCNTQLSRRLSLERWEASGFSQKEVPTSGLGSVSAYAWHTVMWLNYIKRNKCILTYIERERERENISLPHTNNIRSAGWTWPSDSKAKRVASGASEDDTPKQGTRRGSKPKGLSRNLRSAGCTDII